MAFPFLLHSHEMSRRKALDLIRNPGRSLSIWTHNKVFVDDCSNTIAASNLQRGLDVQIASCDLLPDLVHRLLQTLTRCDNHCVALADASIRVTAQLRLSGGITAAEGRHGKPDT